MKINLLSGIFRRGKLRILSRSAASVCRPTFLVFIATGGSKMKTTASFSISRIFGRDVAGVQPMQGGAELRCRISKSEIRVLFSDIFEGDGLADFRKNLSETDEAA